MAYFFWATLYILSQTTPTLYFWITRRKINRFNKVWCTESRGYGAPSLAVEWPGHRSGVRKLRRFGNLSPWKGRPEEEKSSTPVFSRSRFRDVVRWPTSSDIFSHLNGVNKTFQGPDINRIIAHEHVRAFKQKLTVWKRCVEVGNLANFPLLETEIHSESRRWTATRAPWSNHRAPRWPLWNVPRQCRWCGRVEIAWPVQNWRQHHWWRRTVYRRRAGWSPKLVRQESFFHRHSSWQVLVL